MVPGKRFHPEDIAEIGLRRIWWLLVPLGLVAAGTAAVARELPNSYRSTVVIQVVPQQVPENYVRQTVRWSASDHLNAISETILSRTNLERIITDLNLYPDERRTGIMQDIVDNMHHRDIHVVPTAADIFTISYSGSSPRTVKDVADRLGSLFIDQDQREREQQAEDTDQFLDSQLEDARKQLNDNEQKVAAYRTEHAGELPTQLATNLQGVQNTEMRIQATVQSVNQDRDHRLLLERQLKDLEQQAPSPDSPAAPPAAGGGTTAQRLTAARNDLAVMQTQLKYKPDHPAVKAQLALIADLEKKLNADALTQPVSTDDSATVPPAERLRRQRMSDLQAQMDQLDKAIKAKLDDEARLRDVSSNYQKRAEAAPTRETELIQLTRDYSTEQQLYTSLLTRKEEAKIAANLERRQIGEQFSILEQAQVPDRPDSPNRRQINLMGIGVGLCVGLALVVLVEYLDKTFEVDTDVARVLNLPVLAAVPLMRSASERRRHQRLRVLMHSAMASVVMVCFAVVAYTYLR